jgi:hypothetical protein
MQGAKGAEKFFDLFSHTFERVTGRLGPDFRTAPPPRVRVSGWSFFLARDPRGVKNRLGPLPRSEAGGKRLGAQGAEFSFCEQREPGPKDTLGCGLSPSLGGGGTDWLARPRAVLKGRNFFVKDRLLRTAPKLGKAAKIRIAAALSFSALRAGGCRCFLLGGVAYWDGIFIFR